MNKLVDKNWNVLLILSANDARGEVFTDIDAFQGIDVISYSVLN